MRESNSQLQLEKLNAKKKWMKMNGTGRLICLTKEYEGKFHLRVANYVTAHSSGIITIIIVIAAMNGNASPCYQCLFL